MKIVNIIILVIFSIILYNNNDNKYISIISFIGIIATLVADRIFKETLFWWLAHLCYHLKKSIS